MAGFFSVKNFEVYQHYKDRDPPWIKLHFGLLNDYAFGILPDAAKAHLLQIGLLASRCGNKVPLDAEWVGKRINSTGPVDLEAFMAAGWIIVANDAAPALAGKRAAWPSRHISEAIKKAVHERGGGKCQECGTTERIEYDHIIPVSKGGEGTEANLQLLCAPCNRKKRSNLLRRPAQPRSVETETETETETQVEAETEHKPLRVLPDGVKQEAWDGFVEMRKRIRAPLTARATALAFGTLAKLRESGNEPNAVLDQSTQNCWKGLFEITPPRSDGRHDHGKRRSATANAIEGAAMLYRQWEAEEHHGAPDATQPALPAPNHGAKPVQARS